MSEYGADTPTIGDVPRIVTPPVEPHLPPRQWLAKNLFPSKLNTLLTIVASLVILAIVRGRR